MNTDSTNPRITRISRRFAIATVLMTLWSGSHPLSLQAAARPEDTATQRAQTALAKRGFFFETPDGQLGTSTVDAIRRFQIREGLPVSGKLDDATTRALDLSTGADKPGASAAAADRDFLREQGLTTVPPPAPSPTPRRAPATTPPPPPAPARKAAPAPVPARGPVPAEGSEVFTNVPPGRRLPPAVSTGAAVTPGEAAGFLRRYLAAGAADNVGPELTFFAPEVEYFNNGRVSRRFIERDQSAYRRRWPFRRYELERDPELVRRSPDGIAELRYRLRYQVESPAKVAAGRTEGELRIRRVLGGSSDDFEIVSIKERPL